MQADLLPVSNVVRMGLLARMRKTTLDTLRKRRASAVTELRNHLMQTAVDQLDLFGEHKVREYVEIATTWTDNEIVQMCDALIVRSLEDLKHASNGDVRRELFEWFSPDAPHGAPFSFAWCARVAGLDADVIRRSVLAMYREEIAAIVAADELAVPEPVAKPRQCEFALAMT